MPLNIMKPTLSVLNLLIHIPQEVVPLLHALPHLVQLILSPSLDIPIVQVSLLSPVPSKEDPSPLPLMPKTGHLIAQESTPTVEPHSITESYLPDIPPPIG